MLKVCLEGLMDLIPEILIKKRYSYTAVYEGRDGQTVLSVAWGRGGEMQIIR